MTREEAIKWMQAEKASLERAPDLNGCPMTAVWQEAIDVYDMAISALRAQQDHFREDTKMVEPLENDVSDKDVWKWISVKDRLPGDGENVLTFRNGIVEVQEYEKRRNGWIKRGWFWSMATVTHWMPLPEPPEERTV